MSAVRDIPIGVPAGRDGYSRILLVLTVLFLAGAGAFAYMLATAPESVPWGFLVANFIFLLGISQFGVAFAAIMRICRTNWARPFYRLGEIATLAFFPFAIVLFLLIYAYGKEHLFHWFFMVWQLYISLWDCCRMLRASRPNPVRAGEAVCTDGSGRCDSAAMCDR
jgi:Ni/Fe-hydrogenase subunit HybB-like protein